MNPPSTPDSMLKGADRRRKFKTQEHSHLKDKTPKSTFNIESGGDGGFVKWLQFTFLLMSNMIIWLTCLCTCASVHLSAPMSMISCSLSGCLPVGLSFFVQLEGQKAKGMQGAHWTPTGGPKAQESKRPKGRKATRNLRATAFQGTSRREK